MSDAPPRGEHEHGGEKRQSGPISPNSRSTHQHGPATSSDATGHGHHAHQPGRANHDVGGHDKHSGHSVEMFRQKFPNVTIRAEAQVDTPGGPTWSDKNYTEWVAGTGPDVSGSCCNTLPAWGARACWPTSIR